MYLDYFWNVFLENFVTIRSRAIFTVDAITEIYKGTKLLLNFLIIDIQFTQNFKLIWKKKTFYHTLKVLSNK